MLNATKPAAYTRIDAPCATCGKDVRIPPWALDRRPHRCYDCDPTCHIYIDEDDPIVSMAGIELVADVYRDSLYLGTREWSGNRTADQDPHDGDSDDDDVRRRNQVFMVTPREARFYATRILDALGPARDDE